MSNSFYVLLYISQAESLVHDSSASRVALIFPIWSESFADSTKIGACLIVTDQVAVMAASLHITFLLDLHGRNLE